MEFERIDYLAGLYDCPKTMVAVSYGNVTLHRLGLGAQHRLLALGGAIGEAPLNERVGLLYSWLKTAGVECPELLSLSDLLTVIRRTKALNASRGLLAWDVFHDIDEEERGIQVTDYPGRQLARIVDMLARHYSWSLDEILGLPPEVAMAHLQECVLADRRQREREHLYSELAWEYDSASKKSRYHPLPPLTWESMPTKKEYTPVPEWIKEKYYPKGIIVDLTRDTRGMNGLGKR